MRARSLIPILMILALPALALPALARSDLARPDLARPDPPSASDAAQSNAASWAHWDAQALMTDGDSEGALQAEQTANAAHRRADQPTAPVPNWTPPKESEPSRQPTR